MARRVQEIVTEVLRPMLPAPERVIPNGARLSVVRYLARSPLFLTYTRVAYWESVRIVRNEQTGHRPRRSVSKLRKIDSTIASVCNYLEISPDELFAARLVAHSYNL